MQPLAKRGVQMSQGEPGRQEQAKTGRDMRVLSDRGRRTPGRAGAVFSVAASVSAVLLVVSGWLLPLSAGASSGTFVVGGTDGVTGALAQTGLQYEGGVQGYFNAVNAHGGIDGHKVTVDFEDDAGDPTTSVANATQLIQDDHIQAFFEYLSTTAEAIKPLAYGTTLSSCQA